MCGFPRWSPLGSKLNLTSNSTTIWSMPKRWNDLYQDIRTGTYDSSLGNLMANHQKQKAENPKMEVGIEAANGILNLELDHVEPIVRQNSTIQRQKG